MKYGWVVLLFLAGIFVPKAKAQVAFYGEFSESVMTNEHTTFYLPGVTAGVLLDGPTVLHHLTISADLQGRFLNKSSARVNGVAGGPRFTLALKHGWAPYGEFLVGFARYYNNGFPQDVPGSTTDSLIQTNGGVARRISPHFDAVMDFSYEQYYAMGGEYNPKTASVGVIYHLNKR